jgi:hypothetical protein
MPGTNTSTGSRTSSNPYIQKLQNLGSRNESPERFLQQKNDPSQLMRIAESAADRDASRQQYYAEQNQQASYSRQRNTAAINANEAESAKQNDFGRRMQEKEWDTKQSSKTITFSNPVHKPGILDPETVAYNRQKELMQLQNNQQLVKANRDLYNEQNLSQQRQGDYLVKADRDRYNQQLLNQQQQTHERTQQAAQLAAQQRLAQTQQDTAILSGHPGESTWRWF